MLIFLKKKKKSEQTAAAMENNSNTKASSNIGCKSLKKVSILSPISSSNIDIKMNKNQID